MIDQGPKKEKPPSTTRQRRDQGLKDQTYISLGSGVKLLHEDYYLKAMGGQMVKSSFRKLLRLIRVPMIEIGQSRYVDVNTFELAMCALLRIGEPDVFTPGCQSSLNGKASPLGMTPERTEEHWRVVLRDLVLRKKLNAADVTHRSREALRLAARRLTTHGAHLVATAEQQRHDEILRERHDLDQPQDPILDE